eukprot:scaffold26185_cov62-Phaeocystis_antarctica.AAC.10
MSSIECRSRFGSVGGPGRLSVLATCTAERAAVSARMMRAARQSGTCDTAWKMPPGRSHHSCRFTHGCSMSESPLFGSAIDSFPPFNSSGPKKCFAHRVSAACRVNGRPPLFGQPSRKHVMLSHNSGGSGSSTRWTKLGDGACFEPLNRKAYSIVPEEGDLVLLVVLIEVGECQLQGLRDLPAKSREQLVVALVARVPGARARCHDGAAQEYGYPARVQHGKTL